MSRVDVYGRELDGFDKVIPHQMNALAFANAIPGLAAQFSRRVPDEFWSRDIDEQEVEVREFPLARRVKETRTTKVAVVACPCGETPRVPLGKIVGCGCERFYVWAGRTVRVANSPADA